LAVSLNEAASSSVHEGADLHYEYLAADELTAYASVVDVLESCLSLSINTNPSQLSCRSHNCLNNFRICMGVRMGLC
jgi:hypothetical protein